MSKYNVEYVLNLKDKLSAGLKNITSATKAADSEFSRLSSNLKTMAAGYLGFEFLRGSVNVAAEFEKLEAVLSKTLGSRSMAQKALLNIEQFATKTPYEVKELSDSFIKLANRGAKPTNKQMTAMGDVAAVLGKDFSQLTEAMLDVNNTERWTELGMKAVTTGNKVSITYRGVTHEVERTEQGVLGAIEAFGQMEGVAGTMGEIMDTTAGKISNFGDVWTQFQKTSGQAIVEIDSSLGILSKASEILIASSGFIKTLTGEMTIAQADYNTVIKTESELINQIVDSNRIYIDILKKSTETKATDTEKTNLYAQSLQNAFLRSNELIKQMESVDRYNWTGSLTDGFIQFASQVEASKHSIEELKYETFEYLKTLDDISRGEAFKNIANQFGASADMIRKTFDYMNAEEKAGIRESKLPIDPKKAKTGSKTGSNATSSTLTSRSPQTFNINITKLVETINTTKPQLNTTDSQTMRQITEALVMAVNDVQTTVQ